MNSLVTICARGESNGIPGKNIKILNCIPLLGYWLDIGRHQNYLKAQKDIKHINI
jgi:CMP-N-acetylneuraminic acid synthetase